MKERKTTLKRTFRTLDKKGQEEARKYALEQSRLSRPEGQTHREFAEKNKQFRDACEAAGVKPTRRQAQKFRAGKGSAYSFVREGG
jgi:hypothetical protein